VRAYLAALALVVIGCSCCAMKSGGSAAEVTASEEAAPEVASVRRAEDEGHGHFGLNGGFAPQPGDHNPNLTRRMAELEDLPPMLLRHPGVADLTWNCVQPAPGQWTWEMADAFMEYERYTLVAELYAHMGMPYFFGGDFSREHMESLAAQGGGTPRERARYFREHALDMANPTQRADAKEYVTTTVQRYADQVYYWELGTEIIAEPNLVEMMKHTYEWVHANDPDCQVIMPSMAGTDERMFQRQIGSLDRRLTEGMGAYFDIAGYHDYAPVDGLEDRYDLFEETLAKHGVQRPIWVTETGTSSGSDSVLSGRSSEARQAREVVQRLVILSAKGAEVVLWHNFKHSGRKTAFAGANLVDHRMGPKPGYHTFKLTLQQLDDYRSVEKLPIDGLSAYLFTFDGRAPVFVVWAEVEGTADLSFELPRAKVTHIIEESGQTEPLVEEVAGKAVPVGPSPVFITTP
jgi:hypothetical protein